MKKKYVTVLHINSYKDFDSVHNLSTKVINSLTANVATYAVPNPTVAVITTETNTLKTNIGDAKSGNHQKVQARNEQSLKVLNLLRTESNYVNTIANGDRAIILLSGFDASNEPAPHAIPDKVIIKRIEDGKTAHSAKIFIVPADAGLLYTVQMYKITDTTKTFVTVLKATNSRKLVLENLDRGVEIFIQVCAMNARGEGDWSETSAFMPR